MVCVDYRELQLTKRAFLVMVIVKDINILEHIFQFLQKAY